MFDIILISIAVIVLIFVFIAIKKKKKDIKKGEKEEGRDYHEGQAKDTKFRS